MLGLPPLLLAAPALAAPSANVGAAQAAAGLAPLAPGAIRFTALQPEGRGGTIYEARRGPGGATRTIVDLAASPGGGWTVAARETKPLAGETLDYLAGRIGTALAAAAPLGLCVDAPEYLAERGGESVAGCGPDGETAVIARALGLADPVRP